MLNSPVLYDNNFIVSQIAGSAALEGVVVSERMKKTAYDILAGRISAEAATQAVLARIQSLTAQQ
jgi:ribosomal protein S17